MGRTPLPLRILVTEESMLMWPEIEALSGQGHTVMYQPLGEADVVLGPQAWRMDEALRPYLELAIKEARARLRTLRAARRATE